LSHEDLPLLFFHVLVVIDSFDKLAVTLLHDVAGMRGAAGSDWDSELDVCRFRALQGVDSLARFRNDSRGMLHSRCV
jgi:hypothetical protein